MTKIVTFKNKLPTGAATSPIISNFIFDSVDKVLSKIPNLIYSRYCDDLTFSSNDYTKTDFLSLISFIQSILEINGFEINQNKLKVASKSQKQVITGITINEWPNVSRKYIRNIRAIFHSIERFGIAKTIDKYCQVKRKNFVRAIRRYYLNTDNFYISYEAVNQHLSMNNILKERFFYSSIRSSIGHIGFVRGKNDHIYLKYKELFKVVYNVYKNTNLFFRNEPIIPIQKNTNLSYVTNATANSIVYYAYKFLKHYNLNDAEIIKLRNQLKIDGNLNYSDLFNNFINQSAYFINLYAYMNENDRFEHFTEELSKNGSFNTIFKNSTSHFSLIKQFNRKIFHIDNNCTHIKNDYEEEGKFHLNTGVFSEKKISNDKNKEKVYIVTSDFLEKLGMRMCKICSSEV